MKRYEQIMVKEYDGTSVYTIRNESPMVYEEKHYLRKQENVSAAFESLIGRTGTQSVITNLKASGEIVY